MFDWKTCRRFCRLSRSSALWINTIKWISSIHPNILQPLPLPLWSLTSEQLESLVAQAVRVERGWSRRRLVPPRTVLLQAEPGWMVDLVPGGRWFLTGTTDKSGRVLYYDRDNPTLPSRTLISLVTPDGADAREFTLQVVQESTPLIFDLVVVFASSCTSSNLTAPDDSLTNFQIITYLEESWAFGELLPRRPPDASMLIPGVRSTCTNILHLSTGPYQSLATIYYAYPGMHPAVLYCLNFV